MNTPASTTVPAQGAGAALPPDYHLHTPLCGHADGDPAAYRVAAARLGLEEICFCDHMPSDGSYDVRHRMGLGQYQAYRAMIVELKDGRAPEVLFGLEADYYPGCEEFVRRLLGQYPFDLVLGSVHVLDDWVFDNPAERKRWDTADVTAVWRRYFDNILRLARSGLYDVVAHIDLPKKFGHRIGDRGLREIAAPALDAVAAAGMGVEINTSGLRRPVGEIYPSLPVLQLMHERGIPICFGSDAHRPEEVAENFPTALALARQAGYTERMRFRDRKKRMEPLPS